MGLTKSQYTSLEESYNYFNKKLFEGKLPDCIITLNRKARTLGYHHFERFSKREGKEKFTEISLNPDGFTERTDEEILSTLVHEMVHHWQYQLGDPPRAGYHDKHWGQKMKEIGLYPSRTGEPGASETGQSMSHYIIEGGEFEKACGAFLLNGKKLLLESIPLPKIEREKKKTRWKWTCPACMTNLWGKKDLHVACSDCGEMFVIEEEE